MNKEVDRTLLHSPLVWPLKTKPFRPFTVYCCYLFSMIRCTFFSSFQWVEHFQNLSDRKMFESVWECSEYCFTKAITQNFKLTHILWDFLKFKPLYIFNRYVFGSHLYRKLIFVFDRTLSCFRDNFDLK